MRNQAPLHEPDALLTDNDGNVGRSLGGDVKARRVAREIVIEVPADPYVTKLERRGESATHLDS